MGTQKHSLKNEVIVQKWEESERGWGTRPDGFSLHLSEADRQAYIEAYWAGMPDSTPDEYSRPDGKPYTALVDDKIFAKVQKSQNGIRSFDSPPGLAELTAGSHQPNTKNLEAMNAMTKENRSAFLTRLSAHLPESDVMLVEFAYDLAKEAHRTQSRDGGERYFEHPRAGAIIMLDELQFYDRDMLIAFLLHDVGEDTPLLGNRLLSYEKFAAAVTSRLTPIFGSRVAKLVLRLTKPAVGTQTFATKAESFEFYISRLKESEEAIVLKMVDRLHNLRSLPVEKPSWVKKQLDETERVYMPIFSSIQGELKSIAESLVSKIRFEVERLKAGL